MHYPRKIEDLKVKVLNSNNFDISTCVNSFFTMAEFKLFFVPLARCQKIMEDNHIWMYLKKSKGS